MIEFWWKIALKLASRERLKSSPSIKAQIFHGELLFPEKFENSNEKF